MSLPAMERERGLTVLRELWRRGLAIWSGGINYVCLYLLAIVLANLSVAKFGPSVAIVNAALFIGLDLTARDKLHDAWKHERLLLKMAVLIAGGSVLTVLFNWGAWRIAVASCAAFACAATVDALVYHRLLNQPRWLRINGSNVPSAFVDSLLFPLVAWGWPPLWGVMVGQFVAKVGGGFVWSVILGWRGWRWRGESLLC